MTVSNPDSLVTHNGNSATTSWPYTFLISSADDARVGLYDVASGILTELTDSEYDITGLGDDAGGSVLYPLVGSPITSAKRLVIWRELPYTQDTDLTNQTPYYPEVLEAQLDRIVMQIQQLAEQSDRSVKTVAGSGLTSEELVEELLLKAEEAAEAAETATAALAAMSALTGLYVDAYGAVGDCVYRAYPSGNGVMTSGLATFTSATCAFTNADIGKSIYVIGAGAAGVPLESTIVSINSATSVELLHNASTTVAAAAFAYGTDDTAAIQAAQDAIPAKGGTLLFGDKNYMMVGALSADTGVTENGLRIDRNGLVIPFSSFTRARPILLRGQGASRLVAGSRRLCLVRAANTAVMSQDMNYEGLDRDTSGCVGFGVLPENLTQTTTLVSQSFCQITGGSIQNCAEAVPVRPGPTVLGAGSGAYYTRIISVDMNYNLRFNFCSSAKNDQLLNYPTRTTVMACRIERGNVAFDWEMGTELTSIANWVQFMNVAGPRATACAYYYGEVTDGIGGFSGPDLCTVFSGYNEQCTNTHYNVRGANAKSTFVTLFGHPISGIATGMTSVGEHNNNRINLVRVNATVNEALLISFLNSGGASIVYDPDVDGSKTLGFKTNNVERMRLFNAIATFFKTDGVTVGVRIDGEGRLGAGLAPTARDNAHLQTVDGLAFPAAAVASTDANVLDDYQELSFTPTVFGTTIAGVGTYNFNSGTYTKIGNRVMFDLHIDMSAHTGTGNMRINPGVLPAAKNVANAFHVFNIAVDNLTYTGEVKAMMLAAGNTIILYAQATAAVRAAIAMDATCIIHISGQYEAD